MKRKGSRVAAKGESTIQMMSGLGSVYGSMPIPNIMVGGVIKAWRESKACKFSHLYINGVEAPEEEETTLPTLGMNDILRINQTLMDLMGIAEALREDLNHFTKQINDVARLVNAEL